MRLDKFLAHCGFGTRKDVRILIKKKQVMVNGLMTRALDLKINPDEDEVIVSGQKCHYTEYFYIMMNKKMDVVSARDDAKQQTVFDDLPELYYDRKVAPIGRLDKDTTGMLILSNDGSFAHQMLHPKKHVNKKYRVSIDTKITMEMITALENRVELDDGYICMPAVVEMTEDPNLIYLTIQEGKFHQVKRMLHAVGNEVLALKRVQIGMLKLDENLPLGGYREITEDEYDAIFMGSEGEGVEVCFNGEI
ncbi:16S rRNA pseudouridine(516) synthase [Erysipelotrichaceae bacterium]|nr:16S rRNA pseudouridine(516) synthase [Erysipelotrichaceae bacterium]